MEMEMESRKRTRTSWHQASLRMSHSKQTARSCLRYAIFLTSQHALPEAEHMYRRALALDSSCVAALSNLAAVLHMRGKVEEADGAYSDALLRVPCSLEVRYNYAVFKFECLKESKAARRLLLDVVKLRPDFCGALHVLAKVMMHKDVADYTASYRYLKRCLELEPSNLEALCTQAVFQAEYCCDPDEALDTYAKVLALDPSKLAALTGKASLLAQSCGDESDGQSTEALAVKRLYQDIVRLHPGSPEAHMGYGWFEHQVTRCMQEAKALYRTAVSLDPSQVPALCNLATILHFEDRDLSAAEEMYKAALQVKPSDAQTLSNYGQLLLDRNQSTDAQRIWSAILRCSCLHLAPNVHQVDCDLCHRPTLKRLLALRNITLEDSEDSNVDMEIGDLDLNNSDRNPFGVKLGILCSIPGNCARALVALGLHAHSDSSPGPVFSEIVNS